ncbi:MAG: AmmeMemoRadiSam system protein B [Candidatus Portnoybacteria bacterium]|nr:AmmeMemoRadiSam system protein B [Candidatus Portnoybacteria bacterium]
MKKFCLFLILVILIGGVFWLVFYKETDETSQLASMLEKSKEKSIRQPVVAGQFYPGSQEELSEVISQFLEKVELPKIEGEIRALIVPHAGYVFSGGVAAYGFKAVQGQDIKTVILIGSSHHQYLAGAVIDSFDVWQTPLGQIDLDTDLRDALVKENSLFKIDSTPHQPEHSLEVEVPFLQRVLSDFKLLPILVSHQLSEGDLDKISQTLTKYLDDKTLLIASSDMSHYPPYEQANQADKKVIEAILTGQVVDLRQTIEQIEKEKIANLDTCLCGQAAVEVVMKIAQVMNVQEIKLLQYANSGDVAIGDKSQVVGYSSIVFTWQVPSETSSSLELNSQQKSKLLEIARTSVEKYILENQIPDFAITDSLLNESLGAFVTLKKHGQLRGCIGRFEPDIPLYQVVSQMAVAAATQDTRFNPVQSDELQGLEYEISVLSPLRKIADWQEIEIGRHGVQIKQGFRSGVFLPQVATENNWDLDKFMGELCSQKAGLPWDCWKDGQVDIYVFTAEVFEE